MSEANGKAVKVAVCLAATDFVHTMFAYDYARLLAWSVAQMPEASFGPFIATGSAIPEQRENLVANALAKGYSHVLFVDSDMRFPKDALIRLLAHDVPIVGAAYCERRLPYRPVVFSNLVTNERLYTTPQHMGIEQVAALGFGCVLLQRAALEAVEMPRFTWGWNPNAQGHIGEDIFFCHKAGQAGIPIWVDHDLTKELGHLGLYEFTNETALKAREMTDEPLLKVVS